MEENNNYKVTIEALSYDVWLDFWGYVSSLFQKKWNKELEN